MKTRRWMVAFLLVCPLLARGDTTPHQELEKYDDGTIHFKVPLDSQGKRNGVYTAFFPGGKKIQEQAIYVHGDLSGPRQVSDEKGMLLNDEMWVKGRLVLPKSQRMIQAARQQMLRDATAAVMKLGKISNPRAPKNDMLARALAKVNTYRYLCDLPSDVGLDDQEINVSQYASELLVKVGHLTHTPEQPRGYDPTAYELGRQGCGHSNLFEGGDAVASVDAYMDDSDPGNIDRLGHRRWVLNPGMGKTGFGVAGKFSAMFSFDNSRTPIPDYDFVCFPPRGYCPRDLFNASYAWSVSFNPQKYQVSSDAKIDIYLVNASLVRANQPLAMTYSHVDLGGYGIPNAIIGRPRALPATPGAVYEVVVSGVTSTKDATATKDATSAPNPTNTTTNAPNAPAGEISYFVTFY